LFVIYIALYETVDNILNQQCVSRTLKRWSFFGLLICEKFDACKLKSNFPDQFLRKLRRIYDGEFDSALVKNELMLTYGSPYTKLDNGNKAAIRPPHLNKGRS